MSARRSFLKRLLGDTRGAMAVETAIIVPILVTLSLSSFDVSRMIARQNELQSAADEAAQIGVAAKPDTQAKINAIKDVIQTSTGLGSSAISMSTVYRCQTGGAYVNNTNDCSSGTVAWKYLQINIVDQYTPVWTKFGISKPLTFNVTRNVLVAG